MALYRIGTAARLSGLPAATLRNWEQRYGEVRAIRSEGHQRLYSREDIDRLRQLKEWVDGGLSAGEAHALLREWWSNSRGPAADASSRWLREEARRVRAAAAATNAKAAVQRARAAAMLEALGARSRNQGPGGAA